MRNGLEEITVLPEAFLERMQRMLGGEYEAFLKTMEEESVHALRMNSLKMGMDGLSAAEKYGGSHMEKAEFAHLTKVSWAEEGYYYLTSDQPGKHPFHEAGLYYIQEPSAMAPAELLKAEPGERVLDLCAAPGGKSTQIAAKMRGSGVLLCNEIHPARAKILSENIERMGICNACVTNETPERLETFFPEYFDRILVDAPCSGEGMFRKNEAAGEEWSTETVALCAERQDGILDCAAGMLRPGGTLVYSTCTFAPEENEGSVSRFLRKHPDFSIVTVEKEKMGFHGADGVPEYVEDPVPGLENTLRLWPQRIKGEGHFAAVLKRAGEKSNFVERQRPAALGSLTEKEKPAGRGGKKNNEMEGRQELIQFCRENLRLPEMRDREEEGILAGLGRAAGMQGELRPVRFGEHFYLAPAWMPSIKGLRVLRPGLHLGERKKNRFEPSHALALALAPQTAVYTWEMEAGSAEILQYLNGQTFPAEGEKGWYLICVDGFGIGWGKLSGGMMKNHYPRGLRR